MFTILATLCLAASLPAAPLFAPVQDPAKKVEVYNEAADARVDIAAALKLAKKDDTRVLLVFGANWCGWCVKLHETMRSDRAIATQLRNEYEVVRIDIGQFDKNLDLIEKFELPLKTAGVPFVAVLDSAGKVVARIETSPLEKDGAHDPAKVLAMLKQHQVPALVAKDVLASARAEAKKAGKTLFVHLGAPWCGWCHRLEAWLHQEDVAALLAKDFVLVKIDQDRMVGGMELATLLREGQGGGIPWVALYNGKGEKMATSSGPQGNTGCPVDPHEIRHFMNMLRIGAIKLSDKELAALEASLTEHGKKIRAGQ
jgi:thiol:disulfide interchange protein